MSKTQGKPARPPADDVRTPPHNDDAERSVLGCVMLDNTTVGLIAAYLKPEDFYRESHRMIWRAMLHMHERELGIDVITLADELVTRGQLDDVGGAKVLNELSRYTASAAAIEFYLRIIAEDAAQRRLIARAQKLIDAMYDDSVRGDELPAALAKIAVECAPRRPGGQGVEGAALVDEWNAWLVEGLQPSGAALSTGVPEMDEILDGGLRFRRSYYFGAMSKMGKTSLMIWLATQAIRSGWAVDFLSVEMGRPELMDRLIACLAGVDMRRYRHILQIRYDLERGQLRRQLTREEEREHAQEFDGWHEKVDAARHTMRRALVRLDLQPAPIARDFYLAVQARRLQLEARGHDPRKVLVIADYLQSFRTGNNKIDAEDHQRIAQCSMRLNIISKDFDCPILIPFQFGREAEKAFAASGKTPTFADARGSSQIANDANHLLVYHRPFWRETGARGSYVRLTSELSRTQMGTPTIHLAVDGPRQRYTRWQDDVPSDEEIEQLARGARQSSRSPDRGGSRGW